MDSVFLQHFKRVLHPFLNLSTHHEKIRFNFWFCEPGFMYNWAGNPG